MPDSDDTKAKNAASAGNGKGATAEAGKDKSEAAPAPKAEADLPAAPKEAGQDEKKDAASAPAKEASNDGSAHAGKDQPEVAHASKADVAPGPKVKAGEDKMTDEIEASMGALDTWIHMGNSSDLEQTAPMVAAKMLKAVGDVEQEVRPLRQRAAAMLQKAAGDVTERARACSYHSSLEVL